MPVSLVGPVRLNHRRDRCQIRPERRDWLEALGLRTAHDFLALPGVVVSGHIGRNVSRVGLGGTIAYLKREHLVRFRDRFRSWRDGFGCSSISAREAAVLRRLDAHGLPSPKWLAYGEADGQAFLLLEAAEGMVDVRSLPQAAVELAEHLGRIIARTHAAGIDQPDLFAKHILVRPADLAVTILDWQRATLRRRVPWTNRLRGLAALRATVPIEVLPDTGWDRLLTAYLAESVGYGHDAWDLASFRASVERIAGAIRRRGGVRCQRALPVVQELVRIDGERACVIPEIADAARDESVLAALYDPGNDGRLITLPGDRSGVLRVARYRLPFGRWSAAIRGRSWRSPELRAARLLFHLERHGIPGPKLLAYGQTVPALAPARSFVLSAPPAAAPVRADDAEAVRAFLDQLHAAGCRLAGRGGDGEPFGMAHGEVVVLDVRLLRLAKRLTRSQMQRDRAQLAAFLRGQR
jgi:hypothetical protein